MGQKQTTAVTTPVDTVNSDYIEKKYASDDLDDTVKWQWHNDSGWVSYDKQTTRIIEKANKNGYDEVTLTHGFFGSQGNYKINFTTMKQIKIKTKFQRDVRRKESTRKRRATVSSADSPKSTKDTKKEEKTEPVPKSSSSGGTPAKPQWQYKQDGKWNDFDALSNRIVEGIASRGATVVPLNMGPWRCVGGHVVDVGRMILLKNSDKTQMKVRRDPPLASRNKSTGRKASKIVESRNVENKTGDAFNSVGRSKTNQVRNLTKWKKLSSGDVAKMDDDEACSICLMSFDKSDSVVKLSKCVGKHYFHINCIVHCHKSSFLKCPVCNVIYGVRVGAMPKGSMNVKTNNSKLPGYPSAGTIVISYSFSGGTQGQEHPNPGKRYEGTSRTAYLPDNAEGKEVLKLLKIAWDRKLSFRIGRSVTTGSDNCVIWNGIHHKTSTSGGPTSFGYPDETYLERVKEELRDKGVTLD